jgi:hypothetical protein
MDTRADLIEAATTVNFHTLRHLWYTLLRHVAPRWYRRRYGSSWVGEQFGGITVVWDCSRGWYDRALNTVHDTPTPAQLAALHGATHLAGKEGQ